MRRLVTLTLVFPALLALAVARVDAQASSAPAETLRIQTADGLTLSGEPGLPGGDGPFPAIILMHGCGGLPHRAINGWVPALRGWGYATLVLDSFGGRGLREVCTNARTLSGSQRIPDAYAALATLAGDRRIDRARIVLMGFSHGGIATLRAATQWAKDRYARDGTAFRAFFPFYPYCNSSFPEMARVAGPVRIHTGEADDWTPAKPCEDLAASLRRAGFDVQIRTYKDAPHGFDGVGQAVRHLPQVDNAATCFPKLAAIDGPVLNMEELGRCLTKGATAGHHAEATAEARRVVAAQLAELSR